MRIYRAKITPWEEGAQSEFESYIAEWDFWEATDDVEAIDKMLAPYGLTDDNIHKYFGVGELGGRNVMSDDEFIWEIIEEIPKRNTKAEMLEEDLQCVIEDLAWWIKENLDGCPVVFRNDQLQEKLYKTYNEYMEE